MDIPTAAKRDSDENMRSLFARSVRPAYKLAWAILGDDLEAQDATQDAFGAAWLHRASLRDQARFDAWFGRILVNTCRDRLRRRARARRLTETAGDDGASPAAITLSVDRDDLYRAIATLEPDFRVVVILRFWADFTVDDIAARLDIPAGTVKSRLHRSLQRLRAALEELP